LVASFLEYSVNASQGLHLNQAIFEVIMKDFTSVSSSSPLRNFCRLAKKEVTLNYSFFSVLAQLNNSLSMYKRFNLLRTSDCSDKPLLSQFDRTPLRFFAILIVDISDTQQWQGLPNHQQNSNTQKAWDGQDWWQKPTRYSYFLKPHLTHKARLLPASSTLHSGDWLHAAPIVSLSCTRSNEDNCTVWHAGHVSHTLCL